MKEWTTLDKREWGPGPWQGEPDKVQWVDAATGLDCLMVRQPLNGHWCGYVGIAEQHPWFEVGDSGSTCGHKGCHEHYISVEVHGGLTFSGFCAEGPDPSVGICHVPEPGRPEKVWWLGFDCAHSGDMRPAALPFYRFGAYRDRSYVEGQVRCLAQQLAAEGARVVGTSKRRQRSERL